MMNHMKVHVPCIAHAEEPSMNKRQNIDCDELPDILPLDGPIVLSLDAFRREQTPPDDEPPGPSGDREAYWAGRNHAIRFSARWAC